MTRKILLIENDDAICEIITYVLQGEGFQIVHMPAPDDLNVVAATGAQLVLIDEWLAGQPGHRLCLRLKQLESLSKVPMIILSTAHNIEDIMTECRANAYICKPFDIADLVRKVRDLTD